MKTKKIKDTRKKVVNMYEDADRDNKGIVYMFHNIKNNTMLFLNAKNGDEAADVFDSCGFARRSDWRIFLELGSQPTDGPEEALH